MKRNPRMVADLAEFFKCKPEEIISYSPTPEALSRKCGTCRYFRDGNTCDLGNGDTVATTEETHSCARYKKETRVCTCNGAGYFCTFECKTCDAFKEPEPKMNR